MRTRQNFSNFYVSLAHCLLVVTLYFTQISSGCVSRQSASVHSHSLTSESTLTDATQQESPTSNVVRRSVSVTLRSTAAALDDKILKTRRSTEALQSPEVLTEVDSASLTEILKNRKNLTEETRKKRQLFREDIPKHRPLSGNQYARLHGFPHPGRFNDNHHNAIGDDGGASGYGFIPIVPGPSLLYEPEINALYKHLGQHHHHHHGNEIVHQYPVEVSQVIQLDHGIKSGPVKIHPDQNPEPHPLKHQTKPEEPADLVLEEPEGGYELQGHGPPGPHAEGPPPPPPPHPHHHIRPHPVHPHHHGYGGIHFHHPRYPPHVPPFYRVPHIFKSWPFIFHRIWPFRRYPHRVKHYHHH